MENFTLKTPTLQILSDKTEFGKERPWVMRKSESLALARAFYSLGESKLSDKISACGSYLEFQSCSAVPDHHRRLKNAYFCRDRSCVMCQWRKSLKVQTQLFGVVDCHLSQKGNTSDVPLLLTLTIPNCEGSDLKSRLDLINLAWHNMTRRSFFKPVKANFKALEITYNREKNTYHPHIHCLLVVGSRYFDRNKSDYISHEAWAQRWREATGLDVNGGGIDIRRVRKKKGHSLAAIVAEVAKYSVKPSSFIHHGSSGVVVLPNVLNIIRDATFRKRIYSFGRNFAKIHRDLNLKDPNDSDLISAGEEDLSESKCPKCSSELCDEHYHWHLKMKNYYKKIVEIEKSA
jgi:plasmid rolling circle replication initiator protein Rep